MTDEQVTVAVPPPRDLGELIDRLTPCLAAHPNEYLIVIARDDDSGIRDGSHGRDPLRMSTEGRVMNSAFSLAIIDPSKGCTRNSMTVILPTVNGAHINCHGTNIMFDCPVGIGLLDLSRMRETLIENTAGFEPIHVPIFEIAIGDAEVAKAFERVRNKRELVAIAEVARKLGRPFAGSTVLTAACDARVDELVAALVRVVFGSRPEQLRREQMLVVQNCLNGLAAYNIDKAATAQRCLGKLLIELQRRFGLTS